MSKPQIARVSDNKDKQRTYAYWKSRYRLAMKYQFYFEAMMIDYALLEDRLTSILYHSGVMPNRQTLKMSARTTKDVLRQIITNYGDFRENESVKLSQISGKIRVISAILNWVENVQGGYENNKYLVALKSQYESVDIASMGVTLHDISDWCVYRNEVVHAALNKNLESISEELATKANEGFRFANILDSQERLIKKGQKIRRVANLENN